MHQNAPVCTKVLLHFSLHGVQTSVFHKAIFRWIHYGSLLKIHARWTKMTAMWLLNNQKMTAETDWNWLKLIIRSDQILSSTETWHPRTQRHVVAELVDLHSTGAPSGRFSSLLRPTLIINVSQCFTHISYTIIYHDIPIVGVFLLSMKVWKEFNVSHDCSMLNHSFRQKLPIDGFTSKACLNQRTIVKLTIYLEQENKRRHHYIS